MCLRYRYSGSIGHNKGSRVETMAPCCATWVGFRAFRLIIGRQPCLTAAAAAISGNSGLPGVCFP